MRILLLSILAVLSATGQEYEAFSTLCSQTAITSAKTTLSQATASVVPKDKTYKSQLLVAVIQATVAGTVTIERSGTAPTATAATVSPRNPGGRTARVAGWCASNVGAGTAISIAYVLAANTPLTLPLEDVWLLSLSATKNVTVNVALGGSGNVVTEIRHKENF